MDIVVVVDDGSPVARLPASPLPQSTGGSTLIRPSSSRTVFRGAATRRAFPGISGPARAGLLTSTLTNAYLEAA